MGWNRRCGIAGILLLLLGSLPSGGCTKSSDVSDGIVFSCANDPSTPRIGANTFTVTLAGPAGAQLTGAHIALEGDMTHPGMNPVFGEAKEVAPGRYVGALNLGMRGDWAILFHITVADGRSFDRQVQLRVLQAN